MGTANFYLKNARHYYAFGMNVYFDKETIEMNEMENVNEGDFDEFGTDIAFEDGLTNCKASLRKKGWNEVKEWGDDDLHIFMQKNEYVKWHGIEYIVKLKAGCRSGYYEGANFDYLIDIEEFCENRYNGIYDELPSVDDICEVLSYRFGRPRRQTKTTEYLQAKYLSKMIEDCTAKMVDELETSFAEACEVKLGVTARFSNGETWYGKIG